MKYKNLSFPDIAAFSDIPYISCCFTFKHGGNDFYICHRNPFQCQIPIRRIMLRIQSFCREIQGKESQEFFHYGIDSHEQG